MTRSRFVGLLATLLISAVLGAVDVDLENKNVDRTIDLTSQLVKINYKITLEQKSKKAISNYVFVLPSSDCDKLAFISTRDATKKELKHTVAKSKTDCTYTLTLPAGQGPNPSILIETVFTKSLQPFPKEITQAERQLVRYFSNAVFYSPYKTQTQKTTVHLATRNVESFTQVKPSAHSETQIVYGPYENTAANTNTEIVVHYENNSPFMTITRLERTVEVSHWGNIAVEETISITHTGALLKGSFSRHDFQKDTRSGPASVKNYKTILPASATGVYYRDTNGNISTSAMRTLKDSVELDLRPRFPLFGGWKTHYTLGYNVPSFEYLFHSGDQYLLKMRVIDHVFDDMVVDELVTKIILPEGCKNVKLIAPYAVERSSDALHYTYLDVTGRPVITFRKSNLVENHINDFNVKYNFNKIMMLQEPLLVVGFIFAIFLIIIVALRLDFSIIKEKEHKE